MARPSVAEERRRQIVEATIRTIAQHGITGATLDRIAEEAGMSRGHIRHFVGNRDALLVETTRRFYLGDAARASILPPDVDSLDAAIGYLFGSEFTTPNDENAVVLGLVEASRSNPGIRELLIGAYTGTQSDLATLIARDIPEASPADADATAYGILSIALGNVFMSDIEVSEPRTAAARAAAERLLGTLGGGPGRS